MSSNKTERLALHSWEPEDMFTREEFNENFNVIDAKLGKAQDDATAAQRAADAAQAAANAAQAAANAAQAAAAAAQSTADGRMRFQYGKYTGDGSGPSRSITFNFPPKLVGLYTGSSGTAYGPAPTNPNTSFWIRVLMLTPGMTRLEGYVGSRTVYLDLTWSGNTLKWNLTNIVGSSSASASEAFNNKDHVYHWFAFG